MGSGYSDFGEDIIKEGLANRGWFVIPTGKIDCGGAPMARSSDEALILPDLQISSRGKTRWVEVKRKTKPAYMRVESCHKHGFCKRQWEHYKRIEQESNVQVWIFIWEVMNRVICYAPIQYLAYPQIRKPKPFVQLSPSKTTDFCEHGMVFFKRDDFWQIDKDRFLSGNWNDKWLS
jgi:hypothetical protein